MNIQRQKIKNKNKVNISKGRWGKKIKKDVKLWKREVIGLILKLLPRV